jgi:hypothetical protein
MRQGAAAAIESLAGALEGTVETLEGMLPGADSKVCARAS